MLSFFPRGVLGEILNLIESVSEGFFPSYSCTLPTALVQDVHGYLIGPGFKETSPLRKRH